MKNKVWTTWLIGCGSFLLFLGLVYLSNVSIHQQYQTATLDSNALMVSYLIEKHPELEEEIMDSLLVGHGDVQKGKQLFEKYGLDQSNYDLTEQGNRLKQYMLDNNMIFIVVIFLFFSLLLYRYTRKERKTVQKIHNYLDCVLAGDYSIQIRDYEESDLSILKDDIYKMTIILREKENYSIREKQHLESVLSDISHQLKTPLTSMYVINDILESEEISTAKKKEMLRKNKGQLERIEWLVTSLLKLSRLDSNMVVMKREMVSVEWLLNQALEPLRIPMELKEQELVLNIAKCEIPVDPNWTVEALVNILKNAHEHTPQGKKISISATDNPIYVEMQIRDEGEGIKKEELPHIFERFYRGSGNKESIGIGLNMAHAIVRRQNGIIRVESSEGKGTTFFIKFYKNIL